jgi:hypothetical protein
VNAVRLQALHNMFNRYYSTSKNTSSFGLSKAFSDYLNSAIIIAYLCLQNKCHAIIIASQCPGGAGSVKAAVMEELADYSCSSWAG